MKQFSNRLHCILAAVMALSSSATANAQENPPPLIIGRWDITMNVNGHEQPSWLEVHHSGTKMLVGAFVGSGGSARPISHVYFKNSQFNFAIPPQWENADNDITVQGTLVNTDSLSGTYTSTSGKVYNFTAVRAPLLKRSEAPAWGKSITLFNGKNTDGWHPESGTNQWIADSGILRSPHSGANLVTDQTFTDFKLHIEFRYPAESNSGVYLRGRYEVQIVDSKGEEPTNDLLGSIYGFLTPSEMMAKAPGEWQSYDITLIGRMVTIKENGKEVITNQAIPGITGGAINSREGEPGPILLQGDHGPIDYRNILITPAKGN